jgi:D-inositol-3-phosphate glycosyltransferase
MVLQAMANGHPVVATEGGALFDVIDDGVDGLIAPRDNPDALAERLLLLVQSAAERLRMARAGFERIEGNFDEPWVASALGAIYAAAVAQEPLPKSFEGVKARK